MTHAITLTLHGIQAAAAGNTAVWNHHGNRYEISMFHYRGLVREMAKLASSTISKSLVVSDGHVVVLTFDDGLITDYELAFPLLQQAGLNATFFVSVENIGKPGYMNPGQIRELADHGMEIGSHGLHHRYLVTLPESVARQEIENSRERLQQLLGREVQAYAPVGGHYADWMLGVAKDAGYRVFASMLPGRTVIKPDDGFHFFRRNHIQSHHDHEYIRSLMQGDWQLHLVNEIRYYLLAVPKRLLGMQNYDRLKQIFVWGDEG